MKNGVGSFRVLFSFNLQTPGEGKLSSDLVKNRTLLLEVVTKALPYCCYVLLSVSLRMLIHVN